MGKYASIDYELLKKQRAEGWTVKVTRQNAELWRED